MHVRGRWVHVVCSLYTPNIEYVEPSQLSGVTLDQFPASRWGSKVCQLCTDLRMSKTGVCIGCDAGLCKSSFHVTWCVHRIMWEEETRCNFVVLQWYIHGKVFLCVVLSNMDCCVKWTVMRKRKIKNCVILSLLTAKHMQTRTL